MWDKAPNSALLPKTSSPLADLRVNVADDCTCGIRETAISDGRELKCVACGASRGKLGPRATTFLTEIINKFGRPTAPITLRRGIGEIEFARPDHSGRHRPAAEQLAHPPTPIRTPVGGFIEEKPQWLLVKGMAVERFCRD